MYVRLHGHSFLLILLLTSTNYSKNNAESRKIVTPAPSIYKLTLISFIDRVI